MENRKEESSEERERRVEKVTTGSVKVKKKGEIGKLAGIFIQEDVASVKNYIFSDILVPAIKNAISDVVTNGINMMLYGDSSPRGQRKSSSKVSYRTYYDRQRDDDRPRRIERSDQVDYDDLIFETRGEAEDILSRLDELIDTYRFASVADYFDLAGEPCKYTFNKYGWIDLKTAVVVHTRGGYMIKFPKAMPLD